MLVALILLIAAGCVGLYFIATILLTTSKKNDGLSLDASLMLHRQTPHQHFFFPSETTKKVVLENGMTVFVSRQGLAPKVLVQIAYNVGSATEEAGERGLAHLLEHMIFKGTHTELEEGDIDAISRKYGADMNAFTSHDMTSYYFETDKNNWQHFLPILSDCMQNAKFDDEHLASEVHAVIQELRMNKDSYFHVMFEHACRTLFPSHHPYHAPIIGYKEDLASISGERLRRFYNKYYGPSRAVLCIVGDVDIEEAVALAIAQFSGISSQNLAPVPPTPESREILTQTVATMYRDIQQEYVGLYWELPGMGKDMKQLATIDALVFVLGSGMASRLQQVLVDAEQIATNIQVYGEQFAQAGVFFIIFQPKAGARQACISRILEILSEISQGGVLPAELYRMVKHKQRGHMEGMDDIQHFVSDWLEFFFATHDEKSLYLFPNIYAHITAHDIAVVTKKFLHPDLMHTVIIAPLSDEQRLLWSTGQKKEEAYYDMLLAARSRTTPLGEPQKVFQMPAPSPIEFNFPQPVTVQIGESVREVLCYTHAAAPLVTLVIGFRDSSYASRAKEGVVVDMMMSLLLEGATGLNKNEIVAIFEQEGASYSFSDRGISLTCSAESFSHMVQHVFYVLNNPLFEKEAFSKVKELLLHAYVQKKESPQLIASQTMKQALYGAGHPYGWSFDEMIAFVSNITLADIREAHMKYISPEQWVVAVVGDCQPDAVAAVLEPHYRNYVPKSYEAPVYPAKSGSVAGDITVPLLRDQLYVMYGRLSDVTLDDPRYIPLQILTSICFHSLGSRIYQLRELTGLFYGAGGEWASSVHEEQGFDFIATRINRENKERVHEHIFEMLREIAEEGIDEHELEAAQQLYLKELIDCTDNSRALAAVFANIATLNIGFDYYDKARQRVESLTVEEVNACAREYLAGIHMVRVLVGRV